MDEPVNDIQQCLQTLQQGQGILFDFHGHSFVACDATNEQAIEALKHALTVEKAYCILFSGESELMKYASAIDLAMFDFMEEQKLPIKIVMGGLIGLADNATEYGEANVLLVKDNFCNTILKRFKKPLFAIDTVYTRISTSRAFDKSAVPNLVNFIANSANEDLPIPLIFNTFRWINGVPSSV